MNRRYTIEQYLEKIRQLRNLIPDIALSTDLITGFPGETEEDFEQTLQAVKEIQYDSAFMFLYNDRSGTAATRLEGHLPYEIRQQRLDN